MLALLRGRLGDMRTALPNACLPARLDQIFRCGFGIEAVASRLDLRMATLIQDYTFTSL
jgi:hypothetical protein